MHVNAHLDVDVVALETDDQVSLLLELTAPTPDPVAPAQHRAPTALVVVLDRSGSMAGDRLTAAQQALTSLVDRLDPADHFGLVAFDHEASVVVPAGPLTDKAATKQAISALTPGGSTDLSAGYLRGLQELRRTDAKGGSKLLLLSDGHANSGVTEPERLAEVAQRATKDAVTTTTLGLGLGYDEALLSAIARGGNGGEHFAEDGDTAVGLIAREIDGLLNESVQAASLLLRMAPEVAGVRVANDLPAHPTADGVLVELGSFWSGELRKLVLTFDIPGIPALGLAQIATLELRYVKLPDLVEETVTMPVHVNVVPGDEAAGRIPDVVVRSELVYQRVQATKRRASEHLRSGDVAAAVEALNSARAELSSVVGSAPEALAAELRSEATVLDSLAFEATEGLATRASKTMLADASLKSRTRGRRPSW
jgi:Ca-activated chloride channel family protein